LSESQAGKPIRVLIICCNALIIQAFPELYIGWAIN
jgi:hypothetical protein